MRRCVNHFNVSRPLTILLYLAGGNTGLVGGSVPIGHEIVLSLERMNSVVAFDEASGVLVCEAGCVLQGLDEKLANHGYMMPLDLGAKGSCTIGGNVSTNAGGLRLLRYGSLHGSVLGVEVVQADGTVLDLMSVLRKDNVGFDLKQLFIGAEGSLGIVTAASIQTAPRPASVNVAMFGCQSFEACRTLLRSAKRGLGEILSAVEFVDRDAMDLTLGTLFPEAGPAPFGTSTMPMSEPHNFYVVIETAGSNAAHDNEKLEGFLSTVTDAGTVQDGVVAADVKQARHLWRLREDVSVAISQRGHVYKYDLSFPLPHMYDIVEVMREKLAPWRASHGVVPVGYGHLGDSNLHLNISTPSRNQPYHDQLLQEIEPFVFEFTLQHKGSVSAEHGLGQAKSSWLDRAKPAPATALMRQLKSILDPHGILNPCKVIPQLR